MPYRWHRGSVDPTSGLRHTLRTVVNPYASPQADISAIPAREFSAHGTYQSGKLLVISRDSAQLPDLCIKTGAPTGARMKRKVYWHPPWVYIFLVCNLLIFAIVALIVRKTASLEFALSEEARAERRKHTFIGLGILAAGIGTFFLIEIEPWFAMVGGLLFVGGLIYIIIKTRLVWPTKMNKEWAWLNGVHPSVLAQLPRFRG